MSDAQNRARRSNPFVLALAIIGTLTVVLILGAMGLVVWGMSQFSHALPLGSVRSSHPEGEDFVALVRVEGPIDALMMDNILSKVDDVSETSSARGLLLEVNSPGGTVVASQELFDRILDLRKTKPVLAYYRDVAASGAYYGTASASWIMANRGTMVGSIGVIMQSVVLKDLLAWARIKPVTLKTGELKDAGNPLRDPSPQDEAYLSKLLKDTHAQFMDDVVRGRSSDRRTEDLKLALAAQQSKDSKKNPQSSPAPLPLMGTPDAPADTGSVRKELTLREVGTATMDLMRDGRVVLGTEAERLGLVDGVGSKQEALAVFRTALGNENLMFEEILDEEDFESVLKRYLQGVQASTRTLISETVTHSLKDVVRETLEEQTEAQGTRPLLAR